MRARRPRSGAIASIACVDSQCQGKFQNNPVWYNFARINSAVKMAPAMAAGISKTLWDVGDIVKLVEAYEENSNA